MTQEDRTLDTIQWYGNEDFNVDTTGSVILIIGGEDWEDQYSILDESDVNRLIMQLQKWLKYRV